jgi:hypothetical protein
MNLLYLPTIIGLIMKYGPYLSTADAVLKQFIRQHDDAQGILVIGRKANRESHPPQQRICEQ